MQLEPKNPTPITRGTPPALAGQYLVLRTEDQYKFIVSFEKSNRQLPYGKVEDVGQSPHKLSLDRDV